MASTLALSDLYGNATGTRQGDEPTLQPSAVASGAEGVTGSGKAPAFSWVALIALLVAVRLLWEYGGKG